MQFRTLALALISTAGISSATYAHEPSIIVPAAGVSGEYEIGVTGAENIDRTVDGPVSFADTDPSDFGSVYGSLALSYDITPRIQLTGLAFWPGGNGGAGGNIRGDLTYYFMISGPTEFVPVKVHAFSSIDVSTQGTAAEWNAQTLIFLTGGGTNPFNLIDDHQLVSSTDYHHSMLDENTYSLQTNLLYTVFMRGSLHFGAGGHQGAPGDVGGAVVVDPTFRIAALNASDYAFTFSDGVGNGPVGVPEPATWSLMLLGFGGMGAALRRRRAAYT